MQIAGRRVPGARRTGGRSWRAGAVGGRGVRARTTSARWPTSCLARARHNAQAQVEILESLEVFSLDAAGLGVTRPNSGVGVDSPSAATTPARFWHRCRRCAARRPTGGPGDVLAEVSALVDEGVLEVTLLGQKRETPTGWSSATGSRFGKLLRAVRRGSRALERVRFTVAAPEGTSRTT